MLFNLRLIYLIAVLSPVFIASCASTSFLDAQGVSQEVTSDTYAMNRGTRGVVLLDVNWGRYWNCGGFENAQLISLAFDRAPVGQKSDAIAADLLIETPNRIIAKPIFLSYALLLEPGEYLMSGVKIKGARSVSDIGYWTVPRSKFIKEGKSIAGSFRVAAGETVYVGNFGLDCLHQPILWRYYTPGRANFKAHAQQYLTKYPFLDAQAITYRLFDTVEFGKPYDLE
jgi:hypothetical protein